MGAGEEESAPTKHSKPNPSAQEAPIAPSYADWSSSMQAYYGAGAAPAFYASTVAPPTPHPYMWAGQHPLMPPYGTPVPYPALYHPGGVYAHPSITTNPNIAPINGESEGKTTNGKDRNPTKKSKGTSGNISFIGGKVGENKAGSSSGNDGATQSAETGSDGSSDATDENNTNQESAVSKKGSFHKMLADGASAQNNSAGANIQISVLGNPGVSVPVTNLSIGMDLWNASPAGNGSLKVQHNSSGAVVGRDGMIPDQWGHDERELKRQKRKQSNRESARRSRLRKQAECEELQGRVEALTDENRMLRDEMRRLSEECEKITFENKAIKEELIRLCGPDEVSKLENEILGNTGDS